MTNETLGASNTGNLIVFLFFVLVIGVGLARSAIAAPALTHPYPRTAALYLNPSPMSAATVEALAAFDVVIIDVINQVTNPHFFETLRRRNPSIIILGYTLGAEFPLGRLDFYDPPNGPWHELGRGIAPEWYLRTTTGGHVSIWEGNVLMNLGMRNATGETYAAYLARFLAERVLANGNWDGLFFDQVFDRIHWADARVDIDRDGQADGAEKTNAAWKEGQDLLFRVLRERIGDKYLLIANGVLEPFATSVNGRMLEGFPQQYEGGWAGSVVRYRDVARIGFRPHMTIVNRDSQNSGNLNDWQRMRYGLATTLLYDGYYNFDGGTHMRDTIWWYDEYDVSLGTPSNTPPLNLLTGRDDRIEPGLWFRNFEHGVVLVNSTPTTQTWTFDEEFERLRGTQDAATNNGAIARRIVLPSESGLILQRPIEAVVGSPFVNGAFARVFDRKGTATRNGFFSYVNAYRGSARVAARDLDGDGTIEHVVALEGRVDVYNADGSRRTQLRPYGNAFFSGIRFALGDMNGDGTVDIVTIPEERAQPIVKIFDHRGKVLHNGWVVGDTRSRSGGSVAVADLDGDRILEVIVGAGNGTEPLVRTYRADGTSYGVGGGWLAYPRNVRSGVNVAAGDIDGDRRGDIVVGTGRGGGPHVRVFTGEGRLVHPGWFAFSANRRDGVDVVVQDLDGDGKGEIVALSTNVFTTASLIP